MSERDSLIKGYLTERYLRRLELYLGYWYVKPQRERLSGVVNRLIDQLGEDATLRQIAEYLSDPLTITIGEIACMSFNYLDMLKDKKKEEEIYG